jgi:hypothetical protein
MSSTKTYLAVIDTLGVDQLVEASKAHPFAMEVRMRMNSHRFPKGYQFDLTPEQYAKVLNLSKTPEGPVLCARYLFDISGHIPSIELCRNLGIPHQKVKTEAGDPIAIKPSTSQRMDATEFI